ncbi:MAG: hypothetical protein AB1Z67_08170 [Candidatus Limnocylindrales bacterium]
MKVGGTQPTRRSDGDVRICEGLDQRCDDVARGSAIGLGHDDDGARRAAQRGLQRIARAEAYGGRDDLVGGAAHRGPGPGHHEHLRARGQRARERGQQSIGSTLLAGDEHDGGPSPGRFVEARRDRIDGAVEGALTVVDVSGPRRLEVVAGAEVDDLPARGLDASLELIGGPVVAPNARCGSLVGQRDDLVGY